MFEKPGIRDLQYGNFKALMFHWKQIFHLNILQRLENALRNFACLTTGDVIAINYNEKVQYRVEGLDWVQLLGVGTKTINPELCSILDK